MKIEKMLAKLPIERFRNPPPVVAVLRLNGIIQARIGGVPRSGGLSLAGLADTIDRAFEMSNLKAVALSINSPGGSPVQSALIHRRIRQLAAEKQVPVLAFAEDVAASGGYWLALSGDEIYAEETSILGSIGVVSAGFGFPELLKRLGIERRVHTAGESKRMLDPFLEQRPDDIERLKRLQLEIHDSFKDIVRARRAGKLKAEDPDLFTGEIFTGRRALALGLIDGIADLRSTLRARYGERVRLRLVEPRRPRALFRIPFMTRGSMPADWVGTMMHEVIDGLEERAAWARFGL
jgi:signal peptide peptidase SppA